MPADASPVAPYLCANGASCRYSQTIQDLHQQIELLQAQVRTDALTGLYNFRFFADTLPLEMERARRSMQPLALILLDVDHFKAFNDHWGHEQGNLALVHMAEVIGQSLRKLDYACRYGGEEFALILPNTDLRQAVNVAERIRATLASSCLTLANHQSVQITASFGVDELNLYGLENAEGFVARVDAWLYRAKTTGRNCVAHPPLAEPVQTYVTQEEKDSLFGLLGDNSSAD